MYSAEALGSSLRSNTSSTRRPAEPRRPGRAGRWTTTSGSTARQPRRPGLLLSPTSDGDLTRGVAPMHWRWPLPGLRRLAGTVMCPSYVPPGRRRTPPAVAPRVLQEMVNGNFVEGWRDPAVHEALDLCLSCKGCASDCPTGIDMATYKSEVLHQTYRGRLRPLYALLPGPSSDVGTAGEPDACRVNRLTQMARSADPCSPSPVSTGDARPRRSRRDLSGWFAAAAQPRVRDRPRRRRAVRGQLHRRLRPTWEGDGACAGARRLPRCRLPAATCCCGLPGSRPGSSTRRKRILGRAIDGAGPDGRSGYAIVGIEPSCTAALRHDAVDAARRRRRAGSPRQSRHARRALSAHDDVAPPDLRGTELVAQPHCHHHAVIGWDVDAELLARAGAQWTGSADVAGSRATSGWSGPLRGVRGSRRAAAPSARQGRAEQSCSLTGSPAARRSPTSLGKTPFTSHSSWRRHLDTRSS